MHRKIGPRGMNRKLDKGINLEKIDQFYFYNIHQCNAENTISIDEKIDEENISEHLKEIQYIL